MSILQSTATSITMAEFHCALHFMKTYKKNIEIKKKKMKRKGEKRKKEKEGEDIQQRFPSLLTNYEHLI